MFRVYSFYCSNCTFVRFYGQLSVFKLDLAVLLSAACTRVCAVVYETKAWFWGFLCHPVRKQIRLILQLRGRTQDKQAAKDFYPDSS